jgi:hypothetical protein
LNLSNTAWLKREPGVVTRQLLAMDVRSPNPEQVLGGVSGLGAFIFLNLTAVLYIVDPARFTSWIGKIRNAVSLLFHEPPPERPSVVGYLLFCQRIQALAAAFDLPPQAVDLVLFDLPKENPELREKRLRAPRKPDS